MLVKNREVLTKNNTRGNQWQGQQGKEKSKLRFFLKMKWVTCLFFPTVNKRPAHPD
jgi:hypothetical protein